MKTLATHGSRAVQLLSMLATLATLAVGSAFAQVPAPAPPATLPAPVAEPPALSALPSAPANTRLPGTDPRQCGTSKHAALCAAGRWTEFARIEARAKAGAFAGTYSLEQTLDGGVHATYAETAGGQRRGGELVFVGDSAFAYRTREKFTSSDEILDRMMFSPAMVAQLAAVLLDQGALVGPGEITRNTSISVANAAQFIRAGAAHSAALYGPPWRLAGNVAPAGGGQVKFSLRLTYRPVDQRGRAHSTTTDTVQLDGTMTFAGRRQHLPDSMDLAGWKLVNNGNEAPGANTLGEAREAVGAR